MKHIKELLFVTAVVLASEMVTGQALDPADLLKPLSDSWPTYSGDYSGKRYSALSQINQSNIKSLELVWTSRITAGMNNAGGGRGGFGGGNATPTIIGGEGTGELNESGPNSRSSRVVSSILEVNGICISRLPITRGPPMPATGTSCGISFGRRRVALTPGIEAWGCGGNGNNWRPPITTTSDSMK